MSESIEELRREVDKLYDLVFYYRAVEQAQIDVLRSWAEYMARKAGLDPTAEAAAMRESVRRAIDKRLNEIENLDPAMAARILALDPHIRDVNDLLRGSD